METRAPDGAACLELEIRLAGSGHQKAEVWFVGSHSEGGVVRIILTVKRACYQKSVRVENVLAKKLLRNRKSGH